MFYSCFSQSKSNENLFLQGIIYGKDFSNVVGTVYILKKGDKVTIRYEYSNDEQDYQLYDAKFSVHNEHLIFSDNTTISKKIGLKNQLCKNKITLQNTDTLGYWRGTTTSLQCRNMNFNVICYESSLPFNDGNNNTYNNYWIKEFQYRLSKNYPAPKIVEEKRANFKMFTIYFDYDKFDVRPEYYTRLNEMAMIVDSHSDFRILITGHTDSDGSDAYNDELSKKRAQAIKDYFIAKGVPEKKLNIDFKGKKLPLNKNRTPEEKQTNRRVVIGFI